MPKPGQKPGDLVGMGGVSDPNNLVVYHYSSNNPLRYIDPSGRDDEIYNLQGEYLRTVKSDTENAYVEYVDRNSDGEVELRTELIAPLEEFNVMSATVYAESSGDERESYAIAGVIKNRADYTDQSVADIITNTGIYGYGSDAYDAASNNKSNNNPRLNRARAGTIHALTGGGDLSGGAYFWEGLTFIESGSPNYNPSNWFVRSGWGTTPGANGQVNYLETIRSGGTVFMRNNTDLHGSRLYP